MSEGAAGVVSDLGTPKGKKTLLMVGGVGLAYVVWSWSKANRAAKQAAATPTAPPADGYVTGSSPGTAMPNPGTVASQMGGVQNGNNPTTNADWTQTAVKLMGTSGYDPATVTSALGKYLGNQELSDAEALVVRAALALAGPPPVGTYTIKTGVTPAPTPTPTPKPEEKPTQVIARERVVVNVGRNRTVGELVDDMHKKGYTGFTWADFWAFNPGIVSEYDLQWQPNGDWLFTRWWTPVVVQMPGTLSDPEIGTDH